MNEIINDRQVLVYKPFDSVCTDCAFFDVGNCNCKAFPDGIPDALLEGKIRHDKPIEGQKNNITFKAK